MWRGSLWLTDEPQIICMGEVLTVMEEDEALEQLLGGDAV